MVVSDQLENFKRSLVPGQKNFFLHSFLDEHYEFEYSKEETFRNEVEDCPQNLIHIDPPLVPQSQAQVTRLTQTPQNKRRNLDDLVYSTSLKNVFESEVTHYKFADPDKVKVENNNISPHMNENIPADNSLMEPSKLENVLKQEKIHMEEQAIKAMNFQLQEVLST